MTSERDALAAAWAEHLRQGGTTPWSAWAVEPAATAVDGGLPWSELPDAAHLELLRALNAEGRLRDRVEHVLHRPGPGRGGVNLRLPWPPRSEVAPGNEVIRVGVGVLSDLTALLPAADAPAVPRRPRRRPRGVPTFALDGLPTTVARLRADLATVGLFEHRPRQPWFGRRRRGDEPDLLLLVVGPLTESLHQAWSRRAEEGSIRPWRRFVADRATRDLLPPSADHLDTVAQWSPRIGARNVHVVSADNLHDQVRSVLGVAPATGRRAALLPGDPSSLDAALVDLLRRVNQVLPFVVAEPERSRCRARLVQLMSNERLDPVRLAVPGEHREWVAAASARITKGLRRSGCAVHADLAVLGDQEPPGPTRVGNPAVLGALVRMIHRVDAIAAPGQGGST